MIPYILMTFIILFFQGNLGIVLKRENCLLSLFSIEIMYLGLLASHILFSVFEKISTGQIYALFILLLAACESAVGLGLLIVLFHWGKSLFFNFYQNLHGMVCYDANVLLFKLRFNVWYNLCIMLEVYKSIRLRMTNSIRSILIKIENYDLAKKVSKFTLNVITTILLVVEIINWNICNIITTYKIMLQIFIGKINNFYYYCLRSIVHFTKMCTILKVIKYTLFYYQNSQNTIIKAKAITVISITNMNLDKLSWIVDIDLPGIEDIEAVSGEILIGLTLILGSYSLYRFWRRPPILRAWIVKEYEELAKHNQATWETIYKLSYKYQGTKNTHFTKWFENHRQSCLDMNKIINEKLQYHNGFLNAGVEICLWEFLREMGEIKFYYQTRFLKQQRNITALKKMRYWRGFTFFLITITDLNKELLLEGVEVLSPELRPELTPEQLILASCLAIGGYLMFKFWRRRPPILRKRIVKEYIKLLKHNQYVWGILNKASHKYRDSRNEKIIDWIITHRHNCWFVETKAKEKLQYHNQLLIAGIEMSLWAFLEEMFEIHYYYHNKFLKEHPKITKIKYWKEITILLMSNTTFLDIHNVLVNLLNTVRTWLCEDIWGFWLKAEYSYIIAVFDSIIPNSTEIQIAMSIGF